MTAEIAIINRAGIALAADSAVTIGRDRVWKNSNKLFHLAPAADVGIMIFGNDSHCGLPWEVIIKEYRKKIGRSEYCKLEEYVEGFLEFVDELIIPHPLHSDLNLYTIVLNVIEGINEEIESIHKKSEKKAKVLSELQDIYTAIEDEPVIFDDYSLKAFKEQYADEIIELLDEGVDVLITNRIKQQMINTCFELSRRAIISGVETGIVFAGFGKTEMLPVLIELCVDGMVGERVRAWTIRSRNLNSRDTGGTVIPFAQSDIAHLFIEGLMPEYVDFMGKTLKGALDRKSDELLKEYVSSTDRTVEKVRQYKANEAMTSKFQEQFKKFRSQAFIQPMMKVINSLPKEEMAAVAEALVETTSLRRRMDSKLETVGGPVDVAVISKADGFVWIKRKHYFDINLNRDFIERRTERYSGAQGHGS